MRVAVVGAGVTGLTLARRFREEAGAEVVLLDAAAGPGGLVASFPFPGVDGTTLEKFYHHLFKGDRRAIEAIEARGLGGSLAWRPSRVGLFASGRLWPFEGPLDLLRFAPIRGLWRRLKVGLALRRFRSMEEWRELDDITCEEFFRRRGCEEGYRARFEPLLRAKWGEGDAPRTPAAFRWGRIHPRSKSRERGRERLGYLRRGFSRLVEAEVASLEASAVLFRFGTAVRRVRRSGSGFVLETASGEGDEPCDRLVWTGPPAALARALSPPERALSEAGNAIRYVGAACLVLLLRKRLSPFYWLNVLDRDASMGIVVEHTNLVGEEDYGGLHVAYDASYVPPGDPVLALDAEAAAARHLPSLRRISPDLAASDIERAFHFTTSAASPVYDLGFGRRRPPFTGLSPGIGIAGMSQVYPVDRNMSHCMDVAYRFDLGELLAR